MHLPMAGLLIFVQGSDGETRPVDVPYDATVRDLCDVAGVRAVSFQGTICSGSDFLSDTGISQEATVVEVLPPSHWDISSTETSDGYCSRATMKVDDELLISSLLNMLRMPHGLPDELPLIPIRSDGMSVETDDQMFKHWDITKIEVVDGPAPGECYAKLS